jgi:hypothetical protein
MAAFTLSVRSVTLPSTPKVVPDNRQARFILPSTTRSTVAL